MSGMFLPTFWDSCGLETSGKTYPITQSHIPELIPQEVLLRLSARMGAVWYVSHRIILVLTLNLPTTTIVT